MSSNFGGFFFSSKYQKLLKKKKNKLLGSQSCFCGGWHIFFCFFLFAFAEFGKAGTRNCKFLTLKKICCFCQILQFQECVKKRAVDSLLAVRDITLEEAEAVVKKVFRRCYYDTEPIGRTIRRNSDDHNLAYSEAFLYGYDQLVFLSFRRYKFGYYCFRVANKQTFVF